MSVCLSLSPSLSPIPKAISKSTAHLFKVYLPSDVDPTKKPGSQARSFSEGGEGGSWWSHMFTCWGNSFPASLTASSQKRQEREQGHLQPPALNGKRRPETLQSGPGGTEHRNKLPSSPSMEPSFTRVGGGGGLQEGRRRERERGRQNPQGCSCYHNGAIEANRKFPRPYGRL